MSRIIQHPTIDETIALAVRLHDGQRDTAGYPYITHPLAVMRGVPKEAWHVAVLHDVLEDCKIAAGHLTALGYSEEEVVALELLTRKPPYAYDSYITAIIESGNLMAIEVKIADLSDNMSLTRRGVISDSLFLRYQKAQQRLIRAFNALEVHHAEKANGECGGIRSDVRCPT